MPIYAYVGDNLSNNHALNIYNSYTSDYQAQGRYSLPMLIPLAYFVTLGIGNFLEKVIKNEKVRNGIYIFGSLVIFAFALYVYKAVIRPAYLTTPLLNIGI